MKSAKESCLLCFSNPQIYSVSKQMYNCAQLLAAVKVKCGDKPLKMSVEIKSPLGSEDELSTTRPECANGSRVWPDREKAREGHLRGSVNINLRFLALCCCKYAVFMSHVPFICGEKCIFLMCLIYKRGGFRKAKLRSFIQGFSKASVGCFEQLALDGDINLKTGQGGEVTLTMHKHHAWRSAKSIQKNVKHAAVTLKILNHFLMTVIKSNLATENICVLVFVRHEVGWGLCN